MDNQISGLSFNQTSIKMQLRSIMNEDVFG